MRSHSTHPKYPLVHQFANIYVCPSAATWTLFFAVPSRPRGLEEIFFFENVMPLMRNFSGSAVLIERTVCGSPPAGLVWDKTIEDILCSFVGENGTPATSLHTQ